MTVKVTLLPQISQCRYDVATSGVLGSLFQHYRHLVLNRQASGSPSDVRRTRQIGSSENLYILPPSCTQG
jgi:hypothetical protein